ncbi:transketolase family protein [Streptomyces omiyaensis]|uniref:hypothetical protein n=1 Tax=Streptomyces omiyaensis TaxID=68247 RepID=UPI0016724402|nr:hypothetical protein [Streptomyces omiyaensis]GGY27111.1 hypothetical protein GCM10010363_04710 [Streptomyces omiyaensis]
MSLSGCEAYMDELTRIAAEDRRVVCLARKADGRGHPFELAHADRFFDLNGVEAAMASMARGLAVAGFRQFVCLSQGGGFRPMEQLRAVRAFLAAGATVVSPSADWGEAETVLRGLPDISFAVPCGEAETRAVIREAARTGRPHYIRVGAEESGWAGEPPGDVRPSPLVHEAPPGTDPHGAAAAGADATDAGSGTSGTSGADTSSGTDAPSDAGGTGGIGGTGGTGRPGGGGSAVGADGPGRGGGPGRADGPGRGGGPDGVGEGTGTCLVSIGERGTALASSLAGSPGPRRSHAHLVYLGDEDLAAAAAALTDRRHRQFVLVGAVGEADVPDLAAELGRLLPGRPVAGVPVNTGAPDGGAGAVRAVLAGLEAGAAGA